MEDLERGLIRTPLEPVVTLLDDPLRVLRAVRFSGRYGFELVSDLKAAILKAEVQVCGVPTPLHTFPPVPRTPAPCLSFTGSAEE